MREIALSIPERNFIQESFVEGRRCDGRVSQQCRRLKIHLSADRGSCLVELGNTKVLACVSCRVVEPAASRPNEGNLTISVEVSAMTAPHLEPGRAGPLGNEITRLLERCIKEARCVDTESLCIKAGIQAWEVHVDVHLLDHDGSLIDAAQTAAITALRHFRRPDVTVVGDEVTIHDVTEKDPVSLNLYHMPICVTIGYSAGCLVLDPTDREEKVLDGKVIYGLNSHREICTLHCAGDMLLKKDEILRCMKLASSRVQYVTEKIKDALKVDLENRDSATEVGFHLQIPTDRVTALYWEATNQELKQSRRAVGIPMPVKKEKPVTVQVPAFDTSLIDKKRRKVVSTSGTRTADDDFGIITDRSAETAADSEMVEETENINPRVDEGPVDSGALDENGITVDDSDVQIINPNSASGKKSKKPSEAGAKKPRRKKKKPVIADDDVTELLNDIEEDVLILNTAETAE